MSRSAPISLTSHYEEFIAEQTAEGRYASASDVIEAGLRLLEKQEAKLQILRKAIAAGDESGVAAPFDFQSLYAEIDADDEAPE
ncbi:antitoxin [Aureimonas sp. SA4125]|uniref:type II toxin-antitoxin system ParD family antitoxin n=1 Tax=Aureimonas sp. SA4125 TaxID=2826993 RepID=UPI001CC7594C|nr:type II toxin-antitoxin system ParD family antitoxin [Aureimonas sp. SA4125]BDA86660.1 antitoxin [Aureimonas sp. SA4125]